LPRIPLYFCKHITSFLGNSYQGQCAHSSASSEAFP
jgi:hypothetical protein